MYEHTKQTPKDKTLNSLADQAKEYGDVKNGTQLFLETTIWILLTATKTREDVITSRSLVSRSSEARP
jgi:hypothetical protein